MTQFKRDAKNDHLLRQSYLRKKEKKIKLGKTENEGTLHILSVP